MKSPMNVKISVKEICIFHIVNSFNTASPSHDTTDRLCRCFLLCRIAGEFIVFRCKYMYYFCFFNLLGLFFYYFLVKGANRLREIDFQIPLGTFIIVYTYSVSHRLQ